ncbi:HEAT repeat domain-containing protein, partial [Microcoleus sp. herbarium14]|uniref:HEAT repeat domain-containing protein n=1 Tax=Microcoleus sp. herbarium14 TaxID=3055439 RepID=UPI002FD2345A
MARKYGKNATTKNNVFKLVEALLALADGEIVVPGDKLKATFNVEWVKEDELLVSGKIQQKRNNRTQTVEKGITKDDLWALVECLGEALELSQPKDEKNVDNAQRRGEAIQDVLDCLKDLDILVLKPSAKTQGFWKFHLKLKHQTAEKKDNLKVIEERWKIKIGSVTLEISHETPKPEDAPINWQEICRQNLALQKELTTNLFTNANGMTPQLDGVYVPLAIVERQKPKPQPRNQQEEKEKETEKLIPIAEERFFEDVLRQGKSDISQGRKIAIIGEPGAGKTTRLQKIADWILEQNLGLPIWIDLAELGDQNICQYLEKVWLSRCLGKVTRGDLEVQINRVWLLLDGVDEMTHSQGMQQLGKDLLRSWVQAARVVVTCRVNVWEADRNAFSGFDVFRNLQFNAEQVTEYIRRWFVGMGDAATGESLELALGESENSRLKELIQNPLRLWMLCQIWQTGGGLPKTQAGLYAQFVDWVYRWKADEEILDQREAMDTALARLALAAMEQKEEVSQLRLRESWVLKVLESRPIFEAVKKLGWLNRVERFPEAICVFYHATFQEYFSALAVDDWDYFLPRNHVNFPVVGKEYRIFEAQWKQVILLWLGLEGVNRKQKEEFIEALIEFKGGCNYFYWYRAYFLAVAGIGEFKDCSRAEEIVATIIKWACSYFNIEEQEWSIFLNPIAEEARAALLQTNYTISVNQLTHLLKNTEDKNALQEVAESLGKIDTGNPKAMSNDEDTRRSVAQSLGKIATGNPEAIAALIELLSTTNDEYTHRKVAESLGEIATGDSEAIAALIELLSTTNDENIRLSVAKTLDKIDPGNPEAIAALIQLLSTTNDEYTHLEVALSLGEIATGNPDAIAALIQLLSTTNDEGLRCMVALSLGEIDPGNPEAIAALIQLLSTTNYEDTHWTVTKILNKIVQNDQMPSVVSALQKLQEFPCGTTYETNSDLYYKSSFEIIWNCAQNLPYPIFYQAWHHQLTTPHPEVPETTGVGSTPFTQSLNLADLP